MFKGFNVIIIWKIGFVFLNVLIYEGMGDRYFNIIELIFEKGGIDIIVNVINIVF